ncbi:energy transducer TonB [Microscilla marina]|uniref:TonB n=1 Tax=Microscilla marina ATCC 23134 TaxID=313606 RepID=A1ZD50_MICM2|nr:energy transducer TonB [Microscilla marina]EAY31589.1 TonB [Microscilla marina ATCC 23134]
MKKQYYFLLAFLLLGLSQFALAQVPPPPPVKPAPPLVVAFTETKAQPVGGFNNFYRFIHQNLRYPDLAYNLGVEGRVYVEFVVEKDGSLSQFEVVKRLGSGCDEEAVRVLRTSPRWAPGTQAGRKIRSKFVIPVRFDIRR